MALNEVSFMTVCPVCDLQVDDEKVLKQTLVTGYERFSCVADFTG